MTKLFTQDKVIINDNPDKTQLRMQGAASLHKDDAVAEEAWQKTVLYSRR